MAELTFVKAERKKAKVRVGIIGPSGSGKTFTALRLAKGIGGKTALIDTEHRRSEYYASEFTFDVLHKEPPFTPERFNKAIDAAAAAGYEITIIDSASHEWAGRGGILEAHNAMEGNSYTNWGKVTPRHNSFVEKINYAPMHIILTIRGKDLYVLEENDKGKQVPKKVGMGGEQRPGFEYELTCSFMLDVHSHVATVEKDNTHIFEGRYELLTEEHGKQLLAWAQSGIDAPPPAPPKETPAPTAKTGQAAAAKTTGAQGQPPAGANGNGKAKDPTRQGFINEIAEMVKDEDLFSPEEREEYRLRIKKTTTAGVMVLKLEIAQLAQQRKKFAEEFEAQKAAEEKEKPIPATAASPAAAVPPAAAPAPQAPPPDPAAEAQALGDDVTHQLAQQGWDDAPPGVAIGGPAEKKEKSAKPQAELDIW
jgi:hypothetical protein